MPAIEKYTMPKDVESFADFLRFAIRDLLGDPCVTSVEERPGGAVSFEVDCGSDDAAVTIAIGPANSELGVVEAEAPVRSARAVESVPSPRSAEDEEDEAELVALARGFRGGLLDYLEARRDVESIDLAALPRGRSILLVRLTDEADPKGDGASQIRIILEPNL